MGRRKRQPIKISGPEQVIVNFGMGKDSWAMILRWINEPETCPCALEDLIVVTAMTGDEFPDTIELVRDHVIPLFNKHNIRFVQLSRNGPSKKDGVAVLSDSRQTKQVFPKGPYTLSQEFREAGTIATTGGCRKCSMKAKGAVIDEWLKQHFLGRPIRQFMGFNADEKNRAKRDTRDSKLPGRTGVYPLVDWNWGREKVDSYIKEQLGKTWLKSCCTHCPFAAPKVKTGWHIEERFLEQPESGVEALRLEHSALSFNPRMPLYAKVSLRETMVSRGMQHLVDLLEKELDQAPWALYRVRRVFVAQGNAKRAIEILDRGSRTEMTALLHAQAGSSGRQITNESGIEQLFLARMVEGVYPTYEEMVVAAPADAVEKINPGFYKALEKTEVKA